MKENTIVSREQWLAARRQLSGKAWVRHRDKREITGLKEHCHG